MVYRQGRGLIEGRIPSPSDFRTYRLLFYVDRMDRMRQTLMINLAQVALGSLP